MCIAESGGHLTVGGQNRLGSLNQNFRRTEMKKVLSVWCFGKASHWLVCIYLYRFIPFDTLIDASPVLMWFALPFGYSNS